MREKFKVINWFGIKRKVYLLPFSKNLIVKKETAPYSFRFFPINSRYNEYQTLHLSTVEEHRLRIQSRYYKNFEELCRAIRKECLMNTSQIKDEQSLKRTSE